MFGATVNAYAEIWSTPKSIAVRTETRQSSRLSPGAPRELYGKQLEAVISIEIRGQRAADCEQGCETAAEGMEAPVREPERVSLIISSERADAILAKLYQLSRNQSLELFRTKKVYINGRLCENNSCQLKSGDMVSARGYGRFLYYGAAGETRKGRLNAAAGVYR